MRDSASTCSFFISSLILLNSTMLDGPPEFALIRCDYIMCTSVYPSLNLYNDILCQHSLVYVLMY